MVNAEITLIRPEGILYGCRFGAFYNEIFHDIYVDDYDIGQNPKMIYNYSECNVHPYEITYNNANVKLTEYCCSSDDESSFLVLSYVCFILYNSQTIKRNYTALFSHNIDGSSINSQIVERTYKILDGKIINDDGSINEEDTTRFQNILLNSDSSEYQHDTMCISIININSSELKSKNSIYTTITIDKVNSDDNLSLKFKDLNGNTLSVSDITSNDVNKNLTIESDRYEDGYYLNLDADSTFKYVTGDPDRYVPKFNLRWKVPVLDGDMSFYTATNSYFGAYIKDKDGKFICISQPKINQTDSTPIEHVTFPIEIYSNEDLYHEEDGSIPIYLVRFKGNLVEQDIFKTNMINSVTDFIKTY